jgi:Spy/CpxP family protein refolding chaperone
MKFRFFAVPLMIATAVFAQTPGRRAQGGPPPDPAQRFENMLTRFFNLDASQQSKVHDIVTTTETQTQGFRSQLTTLREQLFDAIKANNSSQIDLVTQQMSTVQQQQEAVRAKAAAQIYALLTPDQQQKAQNAVGMLLGGMAPGMGRMGPPNRQGR